jgi:dihydroorotase
MTIYLTDTTTCAMIRDAHSSGVVVAAKLYPAGATTNSQQGVSDLSRIAPALQTMSDVGMLLLVHGEVQPYDLHAVSVFCPRCNKPRSWHLLD